MFQKCVRALIDDEHASGWKLISRIPSTYVWKLVDYVRALPSERRSVLFTEFATTAGFFLDTTRDSRTQPPRPENLKMADFFASRFDWRYLGVRHLRMLVADMKTHPARHRATYPPEFWTRVESIHATTAAEIRKAVRKIFETRFEARPENVGGGVWRYTCTRDGRTFVVSIDYGRRADQLRYEVAYDDPTIGLRTKRLTYEGLFGAWAGGWDFVTADNLTESIELLADLVQRLVDLPALFSRMGCVG